MPVKYEIVPLPPQEFPRCAALWDIEKHRAMAAQFYRELTSGNRQTFVCQSGESLLAEASLVFCMDDKEYTVPGRRLYLSHFLTAESCRGCGLGTALAQFLFLRAAALGYAELSVGVDLDNYHALRFYQRLGFTTLLFVGEDEDGRYLKLLKTL